MGTLFTELARKATTLSSIMVGRTKISTQDVISTYPDGITVTAFDIVTTPDQNGIMNTYPVVAFAEDNTKFIYGGKSMKDIVDSWVANFDGDIDATSQALTAAGGVKMRMSVGKTRNGRTFTKIDVIG